MDSDKTIHNVLEFIKLCKQNPLENFFFTIYQNFTLALTVQKLFRNTVSLHIMQSQNNVRIAPNISRLFFLPKIDFPVGVYQSHPHFQASSLHRQVGWYSQNYSNDDNNHPRWKRRPKCHNPTNYPCS